MSVFFRGNIRFDKGKSLIDFPDRYTVIDIETTGLISCCEILEISALKCDNGREIDRFSTLVRPSGPIDRFITGLTGITDEMVADAPGISESVLKFYNFAGSDKLVGYNVNFDINFLYDNLQRCHGIPLRNPFVDVLRIARRVLPGLSDHRQGTVARHYGIPTEGGHRAARDCEICNACFRCLQHDIIAAGQSLEEFRSLWPVGERRNSSPKR